MPHVVTAGCFNCKHTHCVTVCPSDCFYEGEAMLYIDPEECTDCCACAAECPEEAIFLDDDVPDHLTEFIALNAELAPISPSITEPKPRRAS